MIFQKKFKKFQEMKKKKKNSKKKVKKKYMKYFNSTLVAEFIIDKTLDIKNKNKYFWDK